MSTVTAGSAVVRIVVDGDFNDASRRNEHISRMPVSFDFIRLSRGALVLVRDGEGYQCEGTIARVTSWGAYADIDLRTWRDPEPQP